MQYDGQDDAIFNYSNSSLFPYELCYNYTDGMLLMRLPFASHFQHMQRITLAQGRQTACAHGAHIGVNFCIRVAALPIVHNMIACDVSQPICLDVNTCCHAAGRRCLNS